MTAQERNHYPVFLKKSLNKGLNTASVKKIKKNHLINDLNLIL